MKKLFTQIISVAVLVYAWNTANGQTKNQVTTQNAVKTTATDSKQPSSVKHVVSSTPGSKTQINTARHGSVSGKITDMNNTTRSADGNNTTTGTGNNGNNTGTNQNNRRRLSDLFINNIPANTQQASNTNQENNSNPDQNNTESSVLNQEQLYIDPQTGITYTEPGSGLIKIAGNKLVYDSATGSVKLLGQDIFGMSDIINSIKNKTSNRRENNTPCSPVNADDFSMSMVKKTADISAEAEKLFRQLRKSDATVKAMNDKLVSNGAMALDSYFGREIQYQGMDGSLKTIRLYLQKYESGSEKYCLAHVQVSAKGSSQSLISSACFVKDMNGEAQVLYLQDCFGLIITLGTSANSLPCAGDFNWETLKGGVGNFL